MATATKGKGSSKGSSSKGSKAQGSKAQGSKAQGNAAQAPQAATVAPRGAKYTGQKLPQGVVAPSGYTPTARAVALAAARVAAGASSVHVVQYGLQRTTGAVWGPNVHWLLLVLAKQAAPIGSTAGVLAGAQLGKALPLGAKVTPRNWRHYSYHLAHGGYVAITGGAGGYAYAITPKGRAALKAQAL